MPELPEVETIVRALRDGGRGGKSICGLTIRDIRFYWKRTLSSSNPSLAEAMVQGQGIVAVSRRAKYIVLQLEVSTILIHLRMSGDIRVESSFLENGKMLPMQKYDRMVLSFTNQLRMVFTDTRKFGRVWITEHPQDILGKLGPEPLSEDFTPELLFEKFQTRKRQVKPLLMDQQFLAGMGNIYTDEALHIARLHPRQIANKLSFEKVKRLHHAIQSVLTAGIQTNGASIDWVYKGGEFQNTFGVYQRTGEDCLKCGTPIERITVGQRGTHYCPLCQRI
ncbi:MAG: bifunctional DNA-formamidopyrimidine glycosylase/DNA-(apurinic or apyrimidinic site) lyase [Anaerolineaceae bacterium]|nr:bifunctional DNA-formamidopyrimidine glycosylase/DNA-(apurinic or apyrimidinic site) lyase [Anaerolineaceae bacterium]